MTVLLCLVPLVLVLGGDLWLRGARLWKFRGDDAYSYLLTLLFGGALWGICLFCCAAREPSAHWRLLHGLVVSSFLLLFSFSFAGQAYFFTQNNAYMSPKIASFATNFAESVINQLIADLPNYLSYLAPSAVGVAALFFSTRKLLRPSTRTAQWALLAAPLALYLSMFHVPTQSTGRQASSPDMLYLGSVGELLRLQLGFSKSSGRVRPRRRASKPLSGLKARPGRARNVVFVILESVRKDATCNEYDPTCARTPVTNQLFSGRTAFAQMRALDSCTAVSMAVLWSGLGPHESREALHTWPLVFDYARESGYTTAFWTSQNLMFGNMRLWVRHLGVNHTFSALDVDPESDIDMGAPEAKFTDHAIGQLKQLKEPYFLTIQLSNGHYPYFVDERGPRPFAPASTSKAPEKNDQFFNYYQNAVHQQDIHLARLLSAIRQAPGGDRTVVVYTSDHGEAFREHHQMGHTFSVLDEEVLVPAWIDAPEGTLTGEERRNLESRSDDFLVHPDLTSTVLDLLGVWDSPVVAPFRKRMLGRSLLSKDFKDRAFPMTNCSAVWSCAFENWGYIEGPMKLEAREWDSQYHCYNLRHDPAESVNLGQSACDGLKRRADQTFGRLPGK